MDTRERDDPPFARIGIAGTGLIGGSIALAAKAAWPGVHVSGTLSRQGTLPDGMPIGMQFVGAPGSDLRLLELAEVCASALDGTPAYPVGA